MSLSGTADIRKKAASAGFYDSPWVAKHPLLQLLTIADLLSGNQVDYPQTRRNVTFKQAPKTTDVPAEQPALLPLGDGDAG